jgi:dihydropteroate synthase
VVVGTSRKSFIGKVLAPLRAGREADGRLWGMAATVAWAVGRGARIVRVHDVAEMTDVVRMVEAIKQIK